MSDARERLPLFPLGTVLFPGVVLPLHVFEERYRQLVRELLERPEEERRFGVVAITLGHEVGRGAVKDMAEVGCVAELRQSQAYEDGRYDIITTGGDRFRILSVDSSRPYLQADVTVLPEETGENAEVLAGWVNVLFRVYRERLGSLSGTGGQPRELSDDPVRLSYLVAASLVVDRPEKQELLEAKDAATRLRLEVALLRREAAVLRVLPSLPASDLNRGGVSPN